MEESSMAERRSGCKRARAGTTAIAMRAVLVALLAGAYVPSSEALKLASISEDRGHLGVGLLRAVEVVRGRYERAWALISASEPSPEDLDTALELLQENAKQWESLEPAVKLWTERDNNGTARDGRSSSSSSSSYISTESTTEASTKLSEHRSSGAAAPHDSSSSSSSSGVDQEERVIGAPGSPGASDSASRIYEEAASLLAHNRAVLGQALARMGDTDGGIRELEVACPEIFEHQQNAQGRRDSKSWLHCYANLAEMYKTQKRFDEASSLLARMPWLPSPQGAGLEGDNAPPSSKSAPAQDGDGENKHAPPLEATTAVAGDVSGAGDSTDDGSSVCRGLVDERPDPKSSPPGEGKQEKQPADASSKATAATATAEAAAAADSAVSATPASKGSTGGGRSDGTPARGAGAARVAGLNKAAAAAASAAAAAESAAAAAGAVETGAEAAARAIMERHAEAMRASMNELVGELAVTTATRPSASQDWLDSRVVAAEEVLAAVRSGFLPVAINSEHQQQQQQVAGGSGGGDNVAATVEDIPNMVVGAAGHADILREASHYLSAIKGVAAQGWAYVDNEIHRMERHPAPAVKPGFQSRREVIHTFRYLLIKARQYATENQNQAGRPGSSGAGAGSSSGSRWRRKQRGRKASESSKGPPRKGSTTRGKQPRPDSESFSTESDGLMTLLIGAGVALFVAALSSGGGKGHSRRRDVVRQRTATRAAKSVGSYVEPPQRTAVAALLLHAWANLKRSGMVFSSHAVSTATLARTLVFTAWTSVLVGVRAARDSTRSGRMAGVGRKTSPVPSLKKASREGQGSGNKQRSKKNSKRSSSAVPPPVLVREDTTAVTPPSSPAAAAAAKPTVGQQEVDAHDQTQAVPVTAEIGTSLSASLPPTEPAVPASSVPEPTGEAKAITASSGSGSGSGSGVGDGRGSTSTSTSRIVTAASSSAGCGEADPVSIARQAGGTETSTTGRGVPFPDVMTAEQVQAMVEEDERAWKQAFLSETFHGKAEAATTAPATVSKRTKGKSVEEEDSAGAGWSEVVGVGSRSRANGSGGAGAGAGAGGGRGRELSIRNMRAAVRAARACSPGSDPATTTSASSSDSGDGCRDRVSHHYHRAVESRGAGKATGRLGTRSVQGPTRSSTSAVPRPGSGGGGGSNSRSTRGFAAAQSRGGAARLPPHGSGTRRVVQSRGTPFPRESDQGSSRPARSANAPWAATSRNTSSGTVKVPRGGAGGGGGRVRTNAQGGGYKSSAAAVEPPSSLSRTRTPSEARPAAVVDRKQTSAPQPQPAQPKPEVAAADSGADKVNVAKVKEQESQLAPPVKPLAPAWTNTPSHPLGMHREPAPLPPAPEVPPPPPQHQQYWQQQHQHQHQHQHFFQQQETPPMPLPATPMQQQQQQQPHDTGTHHYPPLSLPPQQHQHHDDSQPPPQHQHDVVMPQFIPASEEETFPPPSTHMHLPAANAAAPLAAPPAVIYPAHPTHVAGPSIPSPGVSPDGVHGTGGDSQFHALDGSYSPGSGSAGFSEAASAVLPPPPPPPPPPQVMVLPSPYEQQQVAGRFSPPTLPVVPATVEEGCGGGGSVGSPLYGHQQQGPGPSSFGYHSSNCGVSGSDGGEVYEALMCALRWQVEYYFSADNLVTDSYLRGLMDPQGFVAVSKIIVFNRVRRMTSDLSVLIAAMRRSSDLEILEQDHLEETRVRTRHSPLHWTREQVLLSKVQSVIPPQELEADHYGNEAAEVEEEEEEEEPVITFGDVAEVIGRDEPATPTTVMLTERQEYR